MKISVIIPVHNLEDGITGCLDSVAMQDFEKSDYEVLIVLDACTDGTAAIVDGWRNLHRDINVRIFQSQCKTPGGARNVGLDNATGEYIMFIDGDDKLIHLSAMTLLFNAVQGHNAVRVTDHEMRGNHTKFSKRLTLWLHFFSRELIGNERFTDMLLNEDFEFVKRIRSKPEYDEAQINTPLYYYNYDSERMIERIRQVRKESFERSKQGLTPLYVRDEFIVGGVDIRELIGNVKIGRAKRSHEAGDV